jgi:PPOX class probable F420-dependent enzyme
MVKNYLRRNNLSLDLIPQSHRDLLKDETRAFAYLATVMADGSPQVTKVWFNTDGENILINSVKGHVKDRNMRARPEIALAIEDPGNDFRFLQVRGTVVHIIEESAREHIDALAGKYTGTPKYQGMQPGMVRVIYKIQPESVSTSG